MNIHKDTTPEEMEAFTNDCVMCGDCCKRGSGFATLDDVERIAQYYEKDVDEVKNEMFEEVTIFGTTMHRPKIIKAKEEDIHGKCIFLQDDNKCEVHDVKPIQCKTVRGRGPKGPISFDWFMVNYFVDMDKPHSIREWGIRLEVNPTKLKGAQLHELVPDEDVRKSILNYGYETRRGTNE